MPRRRWCCPKCCQRVHCRIRTYVEDLETGNIQHTNEELSLGLDVQCLVDTIYEPSEETIVDGLGQGADRVDDLGLILALVDILVTDLEAAMFELLVLRLTSRGDLGLELFLFLP